MKAITIDRYGGPEVVRIRSDVRPPVPAAGEVLIRVACAGINFMDIHTRQGKYAASTTYPLRLPLTLGMEGAGVVVALGPDVALRSVGDRVAWCIAWGAFAEYASIPADRTALLPPDVDDAMAAAAMFQGCTAHYLIEDVALLRPGSTCLVHAAAGSIGRLLVQMAKSRGARVFATASSAEKRAVAEALGADVVLPYGDGSFAAAVLAATGGKGVDVVFDSLGKATLRDSMRATRTRGLVVNYGNVSGSIADLDPLELGEAGSLFLTRPRLADHMSDARTVQRRADDLFGAIRDGTLLVDIAGRHALEEVAAVHARIERREQVGKAIACL